MLALVENAVTAGPETVTIALAASTPSAVIRRSLPDVVTLILSKLFSLHSTVTFGSPTVTVTSQLPLAVTVSKPVRFRSAVLGVELSVLGPVGFTIAGNGSTLPVADGAAAPSVVPGGAETPGWDGTSSHAVKAKEHIVKIIKTYRVIGLALNLNLFPII